MLCRSRPPYRPQTEMLVTDLRTSAESAMKDRLTIEGQDRAFDAYIARPKALPAPAVVVLHEVFEVNADIRRTCDELAEQGFIAVAPDLFWRQEPGVDLSVTSEPDWRHGLRLYQAYDRDAGARDVKDAAGVVAKVRDSTGKVAVLGYCLGGLMTFLTAARYGVDVAVAYHGGDTRSIWARSTACKRRCSCISPRRTSLFPSPHKRKSKRRLRANPMRPSTAIRVRITPSLGIMGRITTRRRRRSPTGGQASFCISNCGDLEAGAPYPSARIESRVWQVG
jgi:dienelactone hydrolase